MKSVHFLLLAMLCAACGAQNQGVTDDAKALHRTAVVPPASVINEQTCVDPAWLLTHYDVQRLASGSAPQLGSGYPQVCCAAGVLRTDDAWRCELDWPSSDVIDCRLWLQYRDQLAAAHRENARSKRVERNLATLARWASERHHCSSASP